MSAATYALNASQSRCVFTLTSVPLMAAKTSMLHIRVDDRLKAEATETLANFGLSTPRLCSCSLRGSLKKAACLLA